MGQQIDKIRVSAGEDLLAFIPHMLGYWPGRSMVCIGMQGKSLRATMRLDLPPENMVNPAGFAAMAASQLASDREADGCLLAIFGAHDWDVPREVPHERLLREMRKALESYGLPVKDAWYIGPGHWRSLECTTASCCPWPGKDNASIKASFVNAEFIYRGSMVGESPGRQIARIVAVQDEAFAVEVAEIGADLAAVLAVKGAGAHQLAATLGAWELALRQWPQTPGPGLAAYLVASMGEKHVRDAIIVALAVGSREALAGAAATGCLRPDTDVVVVPPMGEGATMESPLAVTMEDVSEEAVAEAGRNFCSIIVGEVGNVEGAGATGPDWVRLEKAEALLQFLAAATNAADKAPVLCLLAWIEWCKGRGTWAGAYLQLCQQYQPRYRLAELLDKLLSTGHIADCAKDPRTAWHGRHDQEQEPLEEAA